LNASFSLPCSCPLDLHQSFFFFPFDLLDARSLKPPSPSLVLGPSLKGVLLVVHRRQFPAATQPTPRQPVIWFRSALRFDNSRHEARGNPGAWPREIRPSQSLRRTRREEAFTRNQLRPFESLKFVLRGALRFSLFILGLHSPVPKPTSATCAPPRRQSLSLPVFCAATITILLFSNQQTITDFSSFSHRGRPLLAVEFLPVRSPIAAPTTSAKFHHTDRFPMRC
jgi:hypothetical protein